MNVHEGPSDKAREAMYYAELQDTAYELGGYEYLRSNAMAVRFGAIGAYIKALGLKAVLDVGCGHGILLDYLDNTVSYLGLDIADNAIEIAKKVYGQRPESEFMRLDFREWNGLERKWDAVVWAGVGLTWTRKGKYGDVNDWLDVLTSATRLIKPHGYLIVEMVASHWPLIERRTVENYDCLEGCDLTCLGTYAGRRSIRVLKPR